MRALALAIAAAAAGLLYVHTSIGTRILLDWDQKYKK